MPHLVFTSPLSLAQLAERFEPTHESADDIHVHLMNAFTGHSAVMVETHVAEPTITQHIALVIVKRDTAASAVNEYTIQLSTLGQPRPTEGIHRAVCLLGVWALRLHPDNRILKEKVNQT